MSCRFFRVAGNVLRLKLVALNQHQANKYKQNIKLNNCAISYFHESSHWFKPLLQEAFYLSILFGLSFCFSILLFVILFYRLVIILLLFIISFCRFNIRSCGYVNRNCRFVIRNLLLIIRFCRFNNRN